MKPFKQICADTNPKNLENIRKYMEQTNCVQYMDEFLAEARKGSAVEFPKSFCLVTENYFCSYCWYWPRSIHVIPLTEITNLYRTCINACGGYDFQNFRLNVECKDGREVLTSTIPRRAKTVDTLYDDVITYVKKRIAELEVM